MVVSVFVVVKLIVMYGSVCDVCMCFYMYSMIDVL